MSQPKIIAFFLPQFHAIPENDKWWEEGFTEWTNTRKSRPLFKGHNQPYEPLDDRYYSLLDVDTHRWQASLANKYGIYGFCYYHYYDRYLEKMVYALTDHEETKANKHKYSLVDLYLYRTERT